MLDRDVAIALVDALGEAGYGSDIEVTAHDGEPPAWTVRPRGRGSRLSDLDVGVLGHIADDLKLRVFYSPGSGFSISQTSESKPLDA